MTQAETHELHCSSPTNAPDGAITQVTVTVFEDGSIHAHALHRVDGIAQVIAPSDGDIDDAAVDVQVALHNAHDMFGGDMDDVELHSHIPVLDGHAAA